MPQSAVAGGFVDHVLAVEAMPAALLEYRDHRTISDAAKGPDGIRQDLPDHLATICAVLHGRLGRDFSQYKSGTLLRRIQRRMHVLQTDDVAAYIEQLRTLPHEAELLFRELLISVTRFFRDPEAFAALEAKTIPELLADPAGTEPIRVWVAGCATGEEAYSVAILLKEGLARSGTRRPVQIFATDIDDRAIEVARAGLYPAAIAADLSAERLEQNFTREDGNYRVAKSLREMFLFSTHDLVKDPPFSRLDLVSCRNLLIYFDPAAAAARAGHFPLRLAARSAPVPGPVGGGAGAIPSVRATRQAASPLCPAGHAGAPAGFSARARLGNARRQCRRAVAPGRPDRPAGRSGHVPLRAGVRGRRRAA